jgi:hypothetical protein
MVKAARNCVLGPIFIRVKGDPNRVVVEVDVNPKSSICGLTIFYLKKKTVKSDYRVQSPTNGKNYVREFYIRIGTSSKSVADNEKEMRNLVSDVSLCARERQDVEEEIEMRNSPNEKEVKMRKLICRGRSRICDDDLTYCLVIDEFRDRSVFQDFAWIPSVNWNFVLDMNPSFALLDALPRDDGDVQFSKKLGYEEMKQVQARYHKDEDLRDAIDYEQKTTWLLCRKEGQSYIEWSREAKATVTKAIYTFTDEGALKARQNLVFLFVINSAEHMGVISSLLDVINGIVVSNEQIVLCFRSELIRDRFKSKVSDFIVRASFREQSLVVEWNCLQTFMENKRNSKQIMSSKRIPCSSGTMGIGVNQSRMKMLTEQCIDLLPMNQCDDFPHSITRSVRSCK